MKFEETIEDDSPNTVHELVKLGWRLCVAESERAPLSPGHRTHAGEDGGSMETFTRPVRRETMRRWRDGMEWMIEQLERMAKLEPDDPAALRPDVDHEPCVYVDPDCPGALVFLPAPHLPGMVCVVNPLSTRIGEYAIGWGGGVDIKLADFARILRTDFTVDGGLTPDDEGSAILVEQSLRAVKFLTTRRVVQSSTGVKDTLGIASESSVEADLGRDLPVQLAVRARLAEWTPGIPVVFDLSWNLESESIRVRTQRLPLLSMRVAEEIAASMGELADFEEVTCRIARPPRYYFDLGVDLSGGAG